MVGTSGGCLNNNLNSVDSFLHTAYYDESYMVMGSHIDENLSKKILNNKYVDFAKLLP